MKQCSLEEARAAKARALETFGCLAAVVGVGITRVGEGYGLKVNLAEPPAGDVTLPAHVDGVPIRVEITGPVKKRTP